MIQLKNELFLRNETQLTLIEPHTERLFSQFRKNEYKIHKIYQNTVQNIPIEFFSELHVGDFLFIDSSHVAKIGSDVLFLLKHVLPSLN